MTIQSGEREQTDESLRTERERVDEALQEQLAALDGTADAVINRARVRADATLAAARAKLDARPSQSTSAVALERTREDAIMEEERAEADEKLQAERAALAEAVAKEREETDKDLLAERARADIDLATRDEFMGIVSHDLRNLLHSVIGFAGLIAEEVAEPEHTTSVRRHAERIQRSGARMNRLIGDLVDVASIEAGLLAVTPEPSDPVQVATEAIETFQTQATAAGVRLVVHAPRPVGMCEIDPSRILQVLINLLSNAIKFTPRDGCVTVAVTLPVGDDAVSFSVEDSGQGIPRDKLEVIFERFHQVVKNDRRGMGLGLFISKCIVEGHGGHIWATSELGVGSKFSFTVPRLVTSTS
jgi:signal transduction histidine kinase